MADDETKTEAPKEGETPKDEPKTDPPVEDDGEVVHDDAKLRIVKRLNRDGHVRFDYYDKETGGKSPDAP